MPRAKELTIPNWLVGKSVVFFVVAMLACWAAFGYVPEVELWLVSVLSVVLFFYGCRSLSFTWALTKEKSFLRNIFITGLLTRLLWIVYCYFFFNFDHYGYIYGDAADTGWYMEFAKDIAQWISGDTGASLSHIIKINGSAIDDVGYPMWLGILYFIFGQENDVLIPFIFNCILGAYCAISIYRVAKRHFGEGVARLVAIFVAINPNMIYWCGNMFKETEMVFLCCLAIDNFDRVLTSGKKFTFKNLLPGMLAATALMFFRTALGLVMFLAFFAHIVMASRRVMS